MCRQTPCRGAPVSPDDASAPRLRRPPIHRRSGSIGEGGGANGASCGCSLSSPSPVSPASSPFGASGGGLSTHAGTIGIPEPGPLLDCEVPIPPPFLDRCLHRPSDIALLSCLKNAQRPWLIADLGNDIGLNLRRRPILEKCCQARSLRRICFRHCQTRLKDRGNTPFLLLARTVEETIHDHGRLGAWQDRKALDRKSTRLNSSH